VVLHSAIYCGGNKSGERLVVGVYVDDVIITGSSKQGILSFKKEMTKMFKMSDLGMLHYYLGIKVRGNRRMLFYSVSQVMQERSWRR
jgi:hypothetical protein